MENRGKAFLNCIVALNALKGETEFAAAITALIEVVQTFI